MLPHIKNSKAGINRLDPIFKNLFEVYFSLPAALESDFSADREIMTEHVTKIDGLGTLQTQPEKTTQQFMGTTRTFIGSAPGDTSHEITLTMNLNLRNGTDNYIFKLFKAWQKLAYDLQTGTRTLKADHVADTLRVIQYNRAGDIFREIIYHDLQLLEVSGIDDYDYSTGTDLMEISVKFASDWADESNA